jgi:acetyl-CoA acetyltransferase
MIGALTDPFDGCHMGVTAENVAADFGVSRADQDALAAESHRRAAAAAAAGYFTRQILPVEIAGRKGVKLDEIDVFEVNEAFAAQALAVVRELGLPPERTNPNGSGISLGHPVAATGAILTVKSVYELERTGGRYALVTMCIGGGQGIAAIFERV